MWMPSSTSWTAGTFSRHISLRKGMVRRYRPSFKSPNANTLTWRRTQKLILSLTMTSIVPGKKKDAGMPLAFPLLTTSIFQLNIDVLLFLSVTLFSHAVTSYILTFQGNPTSPMLGIVTLKFSFF